LSDIPLKQQLSERAYRQLLARSMSETLLVLKKHNIRPAKMTAVAACWLPTILALPNMLFRLLANKMLAIDPLARSSMWHDIMAQKTTEIDFINGAVLDLATKLKIEVPVNRQLVALIKQAENAAAGSPKLSAAQCQQKINESLCYQAG
jgi:2-dehydropantoate 2-reductase